MPTAVPSFSVESGIYFKNQVVILSDPTPNAVIYYTTDGTAATTSSSIYSSPIQITGTTIINAIATAPNYLISNPVSAQYIFKTSPVEFSLNSGTFPGPQLVALTDFTPNASIYYTTDGSTPTSSSNLYSYSKAISVTSSEMITAIAITPGYEDSDITSQIFNIATSGLSFNPPSGTYTGTQTVKLEYTTNPAYKIFYTTDGSTPTMASNLYTGSISISSTQTINAIVEDVPASYNNNTVSQTSPWHTVICCDKLNGINGTSPTAKKGGGVSTIQPYSWNWIFGNANLMSVSGVSGVQLPIPVMHEFLTTNDGSHETQILWTFDAPGCADCITITMHKWLMPSSNNIAVIANNELDMYYGKILTDSQCQQAGFVSASKGGSCSSWNMYGLQCNQQPGNTGYGHWQYGVHWKNTPIKDACPLPSNTMTEITYSGHWYQWGKDPHTTATDGSSCNNTAAGCYYYDYLTVNGKKYKLGYSEPVLFHGTTLVNGKNSGSAWSNVCGYQDQIDLYGTTNQTHGVKASPTNLISGERYVYGGSISCGKSVDPITGEEAPIVYSSATYTIQ